MEQKSSDKKCKIHNTIHDLIGNDQLCQLNCLICYDCLKTTNNKHKFEGINHKTISILQLILQFNKIKEFRSEQIKKCVSKLNEYMKNFIDLIMAEIEKENKRIVRNINKIILSQITKQEDELKILQQLLNEQYENLKCNEVNKISKKLFTFLPNKISKGYKKFYEYIEKKQKTFQSEINELLKNKHYLSIVFRDITEEMNFPIFYPFESQREVELSNFQLSVTESSSPHNRRVSQREKGHQKQKQDELQKKNFVGIKDVQTKTKKPFLFKGSEIIKSNEDAMFIEKLFTTKISNWKLLYRASESNFSVKRFHQYCDGQANTIVFVKTQFNKIIGGFTPISWKSTNNTIHSDIKKQSFLFSLTLKQKMQLIDQKSAIFNSKNYGPTFGNGADLAICDNANIQKTSYSQFPFSYGNVRYTQNNQHSTFLLTGQQQGNHFLIKQWEVWKLDIVNQ